MCSKIDTETEVRLQHCSLKEKKMSHLDINIFLMNSLTPIMNVVTDKNFTLNILTKNLLNSHVFNL